MKRLWAPEEIEELAGGTFDEKSEPYIGNITISQGGRSISYPGISKSGNPNVPNIHVGQSGGGPALAGYIQIQGPGASRISISESSSGRKGGITLSSENPIKYESTTARGNILNGDAQIGTYTIEYIQCDNIGAITFSGIGTINLTFTTAPSGAITLSGSAPDFTGVVLETTSGEQAFVSCVDGTLHFSGTSTGTFKGGVTLFKN